MISRIFLFEVFEAKFEGIGSSFEIEGYGCSSVAACFGFHPVVEHHIQLLHAGGKLLMTLLRKMTVFTFTSKLKAKTLNAFDGNRWIWRVIRDRQILYFFYRELFWALVRVIRVRGFYFSSWVRDLRISIRRIKKRKEKELKKYSRITYTMGSCNGYLQQGLVLGRAAENESKSARMRMELLIQWVVAMGSCKDVVGIATREATAMGQWILGNNGYKNLLKSALTEQTTAGFGE
ncbi:hypothetical protein C5167_008632 [Papaver somniferum]|uniref:Uncharacterized protein n=1 Tax=Papaver somniferum TaxID=3469 RepID=A0A4Y7JZ19_PAPSO|nr:hypothetical protein C5167_008632 [Papaver somniferum]